MKIVKNTEWKEVEVNGEKTIIPINYNINTLNNLADVRDGTHESPKYYDNGIPFITTKNIVGGKIDFSSVKYISLEDHLNFKKRSFVEKGDILLGLIGTIGCPIIVKEDIEFSIKNLGLIKSKNKIKQDYLLLKLKNHFCNLTAMSGGVLNFMGLGELRNIELAFPSLAQQTSIASLLSKQESIINNLQSLIDKLELQFKYMSNELLSGRIRVRENKDGKVELYKNTQWKEVEVNGEMKEIPKDWEVEIIRSNITLNMGSTPKKELDNYAGDLPWITISNLTEKNILQYTAKIKESKNIKIFPKGTLLISFKMSVGKAGFTTQDSAINEAIMGIKQSNNKNDINYLYYCLPNVFIVNAMPNGQGLLLLNQDKIKNLNYTAPPLQTQTSIATLLSKQESIIDNLKSLLNNEVVKLDFLTKVLLNGSYLMESNMTNLEEITRDIHMINAVRKDKSGVITHLKKRTGEVFTVSQLIAIIKAGDLAYTDSPAPLAPIIVYEENGQFYLRTKSDGIFTNNLDELPNF